MTFPGMCSGKKNLGILARTGHPQVRQLRDIPNYAKLAGGPQGSGKLGRLVPAQLLMERPGELRGGRGLLDGHPWHERPSKGGLS